MTLTPDAEPVGSRIAEAHQDGRGEVAYADVKEVDLDGEVPRPSPLVQGGPQLFMTGLFAWTSSTVTTGDRRTPARCLVEHATECDGGAEVGSDGHVELSPVCPACQNALEVP